MNYPRELTDIFDDLVASMRYAMHVDRVVISGDKQRVYFCDIFHAQVGYPITIGTEIYIMMGCNYEANCITIPLLPTVNVGDLATISTPFFFYGTPLATDMELGKILNASDKTPLIWLRLNYSEKGFDLMSTVVRTASVEIYFLAQADHDREITSDLIQNQVKPMRRLLSHFVEQMRGDTANFSTDDLSYTQDLITKMGVILQQKGAVRDLMGTNLTGVGLKGNIDFVGQNNCLC